MHFKIERLFYLLSVSVALSSCTFLFGDKEDEVVNDIFEQGRIDPVLIPNNVGYVPVQPFFTGFVNPKDVHAGYDEMLYVTDDLGLHVMDQAGRKFRTIAIPGAGKVVQDRQLRVFVTGRCDILIGGNIRNVAAVYRLANVAAADGPVYLDTLIHPYCDLSRSLTSFRGLPDEQVEFTALSVLHDNTLMVARKGPTNSVTSVNFPDNTVLFFNPSGINTGIANGLSPTQASLRSAINITALAGYAGPPQRFFGISTSRDFLLAQYDSINPMEFAVLGIRYLFDPDLGTLYEGKPELLNFDTSKSNRFLYEPFRFAKVSGICVAPDNTEYIFVTDSQKDSLYQFTSQGFEGVNPPANFANRKQIIASFGGKGNGLFNFDHPSGISYLRRMLYVADKGNNRICRYKLSTDIE